MMSACAASYWATCDYTRFRSFQKKTYFKKQHLVKSRYEPKQQDDKFCGDISTLFQSHCQTRISYLHTCYHTIYKETGRDDVLETLLLTYNAILKKRPRVL